MMMNAKIRKYLSFGHAHTAHIITFHCQNVALKSDSTQLDSNLISLFSFRCGFEVSSAFDFFRFSFSLLFFLFVFLATYASNLIKLYNYRADNTQPALATHAYCRWQWRNTNTQDAWHGRAGPDRATTTCHHISAVHWLEEGGYGSVVCDTHCRPGLVQFVFSHNNK